MRPDPRQEGMRWLKQAQRDLDDARYSMEGQRFNLACFLAQQAAEKGLKAFLYSEGAEEVIGHSVADLCDDAQAFNEGFKELKRSAAALDKFYLPTRYPNALPGGIPAEAFDKEDATRAIAVADQVLRQVSGLLREER